MPITDSDRPRVEPVIYPMTSEICPLALYPTFRGVRGRARRGCALCVVCHAICFACARADGQSGQDLQCDVLSKYMYEGTRGTERKVDISEENPIPRAWESWVQSPSVSVLYSVLDRGTRTPFFASLPCQPRRWGGQDRAWSSLVWSGQSSNDGRG